MKKLLLLIGFGRCISGNCKNGYGTYTYASGSKYIGEFKDGKQHGQATYPLADGTVYKDLWRNNKFLGE